MKYLVILLPIVLGACASKPLTGTGEIHHLTVNRIIYRDLTQPVSLHNPQKVQRIVKNLPSNNAQ